MLSDYFYSVSDNQNYIEYIIKKHEALTAITPTHAYIIRINNRLVFKTKVEYELDLQTPETMKLFGSTKNKEKKQKMEKTYQVFKSLKKFYPNVI